MTTLRSWNLHLSEAGRWMGELPPMTKITTSNVNIAVSISIAGCTVILPRVRYMAKGYIEQTERMITSQYR
jgi:hypothetical protein